MQKFDLKKLHNLIDENVEVRNEVKFFFNNFYDEIFKNHPNINKIKRPIRVKNKKFLMDLSVNNTGIYLEGDENNFTIFLGILIYDNEEKRDDKLFFNVRETTKKLFN